MGLNSCEIIDKKLVLWKDNNADVAEIPPEVNTIGTGAFSQSNVRTLKFSYRLKTIEEKAFEGCKSLEKVILPAYINDIGDAAFANCIKLKNIKFNASMYYLSNRLFYNCESLDSIEIKGLVYRIGYRSFENCKNLKTVILSDNLNFIDSYAFANCEALEEIVFPNSLKSISNGAFFNCKSLKTVHIPKNIENISYNAFEGCDAIESFTVDENNPYYSAVDGILTSKNGNSLKIYPAWKKENKVKIPRNITEIGQGAFFNNHLVTDIDFPENLYRINRLAFSKCEKLKEIHLPEKISYIGKEAFSDCENLEYVFIHGKAADFVYDLYNTTSDITLVVCLKYSAFKSQPTSLKRLLLICFCEAVADGVEFDENDLAMYFKYLKTQRKKLYPYIADYESILHIFIQNNFLTIDDVDYLLDDVNMSEYDVALSAVQKNALIEYKNTNFKPVDEFKVFEKQMKIAEVFATEGKLPTTEAKKLWSFTKNRDGNYKLTRYKGKDDIVIIPKKIGNTVVDELGKKVFYNNKYIREVTIPNTFTKVGESIFEECSSLTVVNWPSSIKSISSQAFYGCISLEKITIPEGVEKADLEAFRGCNDLNEIKFPKTFKEIGARAFMECGGLKKIQLPENLEIIDEKAFYYCYNLKNVVIPSSVKTIRRFSFGGCNKLKQIIFNKSSVRIGQYAFGGCNNLKEIIFLGKGVRISEYAFEGCEKIEKIVVPNGFLTKKLECIEYYSNFEVEYLNS